MQDVLAMANLEVDMKNIQEGQTVTVKWRGKPVFIRHRCAQGTPGGVCTGMAAAWAAWVGMHPECACDAAVPIPFRECGVQTCSSSLPFFPWPRRPQDRRRHCGRQRGGPEQAARPAARLGARQGPQREPRGRGLPASGPSHVLASSS